MTPRFGLAVGGFVWVLVGLSVTGRLRDPAHSLTGDGQAPGLTRRQLPLDVLGFCSGQSPSPRRWMFSAAPDVLQTWTRPAGADAGAAWSRRVVPPPAPEHGQEARGSGLCRGSGRHAPLGTAD